MPTSPRVLSRGIKKTTLIAFVVSPLLALAACGGGTAPVTKTTSGLEKVSLRADVFFYGAHVPLLAGIEEGIYRKHGLDVTAHPGTGSGTTIQLVANGSDNFGFADGGVLVQSAGKGIPAEMVVGMLQQSPAVIMSRPETGIHSPKDLDGKTGGFSAGSAPELLFPAFAKKTGVNVSSINKTQVDVPTRDNLFVQGKTQFTFGYTATQLPILEAKCQCQLAVMKYSAYGISPVSNGIVVSTSFAKDHPDVVKKFAAATAEAIDVSVKNPAKAVDDFFAYAKGTQLSKKVVAEQWQNSITLLHTTATKSDPYGCMATSDWQETINLLTEYGGVAAGKLKPADVFTNSFLSGCGSGS